MPVPSVFIIETDNLLQFSYTHPNYRLRVPGSVILAAAKAIAAHEQKIKPKQLPPGGWVTPVIVRPSTHECDGHTQLHHFQR